MGTVPAPAPGTQAAAAQPCEHTEPLPPPLHSYVAMDYTSVSKEVTSPHSQSTRIWEMLKKALYARRAAGGQQPFLQVEGGPGQVLRAGLWLRP